MDGLIDEGQRGAFLGEREEQMLLRIARPDEGRALSKEDSR